MKLTESEIAKKTLGCLVGKAIGGTLGMPLEGWRGVARLDYYDPVPTEMVPNDDLDLQVVYACLLDEMAEPRVDRLVLAKAWDLMLARCDEYGIVKRNLELGLIPPATGKYDNWFYGGMGAAIRTEIWACLAPGDPKTAAAYAYEDACMDHADEGIDAAVFLAALESHAFCESDVDRLLDPALAVIPEHSLVRQAIEFTRERFQSSIGNRGSEVGDDWIAIREAIMARFDNGNFTWAPVNLAFIVLGLLVWQESRDYGRALCVTVGCGEDADCTGATLGALLGIIAPDGIPERWRKPIGNKVALSDGIVGITPPATLDALANLIAGLRRRIAGKMPPAGQPAALPDTGITARLAFVPWKNAFPPAADSSWPDHSPKTLEQFELSPRVLPGNWVKLDRPSPDDDMLIVNYPLRFSKAIDTQVMVSTRHWVRVWADGKLLFARDGGEMVPSFHRAPIHQMAEHHFSPGAHNLLIALMPSRKAKVIEWVAGLAERTSRGRSFENWLSQDGFVRAPLEAKAGRKRSDHSVASVRA